MGGTREKKWGGGEGTERGLGRKGANSCVHRSWLVPVT